MSRLVGSRAVVRCAAYIAARRSLTTQVTASRVPHSTPPWKEPVRGGQNLSMRYQRLERSLRGKEAYGREIKQLSEETITLIPSHTRGKSTAKTFMGFVVPEEPKAPGPDECCMSGCAICVQDLYAEALEEYKKTVDSLRVSLTGLRVPEDQWPASIQTKRKQPDVKKGVALSAFEELERKLRERHSVDTQSTVSSPLGKRATPSGNLLSEVQSVYEGLRWVLFSNR